MNKSEAIKSSIRNNAKISFSRSSGHGGQNVNKVNTKVLLKISLDKIEGLSDIEIDRIKNVLANKINNDNEIVIHSDEERSQRINLDRAFFRIENLIISAIKIQKKRIKTKPNKIAKEKRLRAKKLNSLKKANRSLKE